MSGPNSYSKTYSYDASYGHNTSVSETIAGTAYVTDMTYDSKGRLDKLKYPGPSNRLEIQHLYNVRGYLTTVRNAATSLNYYTATAMDARGNVTGETHGNGLTTSRVYQANTGYLQSVSTGNNPLNNRQNLSFGFDKLGNLISRDDAVKDIAEIFDYDNLNRLEYTHADFGNSDVQTVTLTYDALGNIKTKTGVGTYSYGSQCGAGSRFNAVCNIAAGSVGLKNASYSYDANGNLLSGDGRTVTWSAFDKPLSISQGTSSSTMTYGAERNLITKSETTGGNTTSTVYSGGYEKVTLPGNITEERHNVAGNTVVTYTNRTAGSAGTIKTRYLHKDHLGSVTVITNESGAEVEAFSFDPWGKRRAMSLAQLQSILGNWSTLNTYQKGNLTIPAITLTSSTTDKGFTGHRQLDNVGLIHMGGRVYDAEIGRFLSADPFVDDATNLQSLNRYTYVNNNPLSYTDPSGYFKNPLKKIGKAIGKAFKAIGDGIKTGLQKIGRLFADVPGLSAFAAALACTAGPWTCATVGKFMLGLNAAITAANGGTLGQIMTDLAIGGVAFGIPGMGDGLAGQLNGVIKNELGSVMLMGGIISKAQGGKFIDGVKGAAIGAAAGAIGRGIGSAKQAGVSVLGEITHELRVLAGVRPPASAQLSTAVHELGIAPGFVPYNGPVHTNTFVPTYASAAARNTATGFSSRGNGSGWSASQIDVDMALGLRSARNFQNASVCAALCTIPIALAPGAAAVGASVGALVDYSGGSSITIGSVVSDATISAIVSPIGYARYAGGHPVAHGLDFIRTYSAGTGVEAIISN